MMIKIYTKALKDFETGFLGYAPITMMVLTCLGSISVMYLLKDNSSTTIYELTVCVIACMGYNATILGQMKKKFSFNTLIFATIVNLIILLLNF